MRDKDKPVPATWAEARFQEAEEEQDRKKAASLMGRKGGKRGGKSAQAQRSPEERSRIARKAGKASWKARKANLAGWREKMSLARSKRRCAELDAAMDESDEVVSVKP